LALAALALVLFGAYDSYPVWLGKVRLVAVLVYLKLSGFEHSW